MAKREEYTNAEQQWIAKTRLRLAQRRGKKPATKSGQIRALRPEIRSAIADGQSLASIRQWLEEEAASSLPCKASVPTSHASVGRRWPRRADQLRLSPSP